MADPSIFGRKVHFRSQLKGLIIMGTSLLVAVMGAAVCAAAEGEGTMTQGKDKWPAKAFFGLHYDLHPRETDTELGRETTYEHIREQLEKVQPDYVQYDCKGHGGWCGYPSKVGSPSPGIVNDALKIWREVTRDMGIPLSIHYSGVWDTRAVALHPEWARVNADGSKHDKHTCRMSGYTDELLIPQLLEVVENYDIDGVWIDGENWASYPCYCERCKAEFTRRTGLKEIPEKRGEPNWDAWADFHRDLFTEHVTRYADALHAKKPSIAVCSNWMYSVRQPDPVAAPLDYLSGDFTPSFGAERACAESRFMASRGMPWNLMAWTFLRTGAENYTMKTAVHLSQEVAGTVAQGGSVFLYNQPQRSGRLTAWHQDIFAEVAEFCKARKEYAFLTETIPQVAILHSRDHFYGVNDPLYNLGQCHYPMEGALHAVLENGFSADLLNEEGLLERMGSYPIVVVPEQDGLADEVDAALRAYVEGGGRLLMSGAHVAAAYAELAGVEAAEGSQEGGWIPADNGCVTVTGPWQNVKVTSAKELAPFLNQQEPTLNLAGTPAATVNAVGKGRVVAVHGPVFKCYGRAHYPRVRRFIGDMLNALDAPGLITLDGPPWVEMAARKKDGRMLIQFVNRGSAGHPRAQPAHGGAGW